MAYSLIQLEHFYYVAIHGSFVKAARALGISKAQISQSIAKLERILGVKLFHRTTRSVALTHEGKVILPLVESMINTKSEIAQEVESFQGEPSGLLRITSPTAFAESYLATILPDFIKQYPKVKLDLMLSSQVLNLDKEKIDIAIRFTHEPLLDKVAKPLGEYQLGYFASPAYLEKRGQPNKIEHLLNHDCLVSTTVLKGATWLFHHERQRLELTVSPCLQASNHHVIKEAVMNNLGIACLPYFLVKQELRAKQLISVLNDYQMPAIPIYALYSHTRKPPAKITIFINYLQQKMRETDLYL